MIRGTRNCLVVLILNLLVAGTVTLPVIACSQSGPTATAVIEPLESPRGVCAIVGCQDVSQAIELAKDSELLVYVQLSDRASVEESRRAVDGAGMLNDRMNLSF